MSEDYQNRVSISKNKEETVITINGKIERWQEALLLSWVAMWTILGGYVLFQLFGDYPRETKLSFFVYLVFWAYFEIKGTHALLWRLYGMERVKVTDEEILFKRDIKSYGKVVRYQRHNIKDLRVNDGNAKNFGAVYHSSFWVVKGGNVLFDYLGKTIAIGVQLNESDAKKVMKALR